MRTTLILLNLRMLQMDFREHPALFAAAEFAGRCIGVTDTIRMIPYDLSRYQLKMPHDICAKHGVSVRNLWDRQKGTPKEELYDVVLE
jgi:hypothetical protein